MGSNKQIKEVIMSYSPVGPVQYYQAGHVEVTDEPLPSFGTKAKAALCALLKTATIGIAVLSTFAFHPVIGILAMNLFSVYISKKGSATRDDANISLAALVGCIVFANLPPVVRVLGILSFGLAVTAFSLSSFTLMQNSYNKYLG